MVSKKTGMRASFFGLLLILAFFAWGCGGGAKASGMAQSPSGGEATSAESAPPQPDRDEVSESTAREESRPTVYAAGGMPPPAANKPGVAQAGPVAPPAPPAKAAPDAAKKEKAGDE